MRNALLAASLLATSLGAAPLAAQHDHGAGHAGHGAHAGGALPAGWELRLDRANADRSTVHFMQMGDELHFMLGPSGIFWRPQDTRTGAYRLSATFQQMKAPAHPEAYGLLLGGRDLAGPGQDYFYFVIRGDGRYTVKHRAGSEVHTIVDWTEHAAVRRPGEDGRSTNTLTAVVDGGALSLQVNGTEVQRYSRAQVPYLNTDGVFGLRVNHNLSVHVTDFGATAP